MNDSGEIRPALPYSVRIDPRQLRHAMRVRGLTGADLACRAGVSQATISHALNGRRIHPGTLRAIGAVLRAVAPMEEVDALVARDHAVILDASVQWRERT